MIVPLALPIENEQLKEKYARLIPQNLLSCLDGKDPLELESPVIGAGVCIDEEPVGIALATVHAKMHMGDIHFLNISPPFNSYENLSDLLKIFSALLIEREVKFANLSYTKEDPQSNLLEKVFQENHWKGPKPHIIECHFISAEFKAPWLQKEIKLTEGFEEFFFKNLTAEEQKDLINRSEQGILPIYVFPFGREKELIEYRNSLGLRYNGRIVGWMVTHRLTADTLRYSALYLEDEFAQTGYWLKLLADAIHIHQSRMHELTHSILEINLDQIPKRWLKFVERRLFSQAYQVVHKNLFWKKL